MQMLFHRKLKFGHVIELTDADTFFLATPVYAATRDTCTNQYCCESEAAQPSVLILNTLFKGSDMPHQRRFVVH